MKRDNLLSRNSRASESNTAGVIVGRSISNQDREPIYSSFDG